ncbi:hypothetical protein BPOR_0460g00040 [Botrytis porri]|uniref:Uncharacterized protein n=1 Tax=Botrytis porri TaxID=87229 RepID=A0A4Z1KH17_9HELO|nr:hypothetical protein BPOR_0460g00040 [Botrytis porri]
MDNTKRSARGDRGERGNGQIKLTGTKLTKRPITTCSYAEKNDARLPVLSSLQPEQEDMRARTNRLENSIRSVISKEKKNKIPLSPSLGENHDDHVGQAGGQKSSIDTRCTH